MKATRNTSRVVVANLSRDATAEEIRTLFSGKAQRPVRIASRLEDGIVAQAVLEFGRPALAAEAIRAYNGIEFAGRRIRVTTAG